MNDGLMIAIKIWQFLKALCENIEAIYNTIKKAKPASVKGRYLKKLTISSTMGPGIKIDYAALR